MINDNFNVLCLLPILIIILIILYFILNGSRKRQIQKHQILEAISLAGYSYDSRQDIFYSRKDAWQKDYGFSSIYDEAAAPLSMIIDSEPIRFCYGGKKWLIELWKGQYGMVTGGEIGIYTKSDPDPEIPGFADVTFYDCADEEDQLYMAFLLRKNGRPLFSREGKHWWLTGFVLGEFSNPEELQMEISITFKNREMCRAFVNALLQMGYSERNMKVFSPTVWLHYTKPFSPQPLTRNPVTDALTQKKNQMLCASYLELTKEHTNSLDKLASLYVKAPELFDLVLNMGKPKKLFKK
jgi:hypothetical protein